MEQIKHPERKPSENYWFETLEKIYREAGKIPDPLEIRAQILIDAFGLPSGPYSAIEIDPKTKERINPKKDEIIAKYLTNHPGVEIEKGIISLDFRDMYPDDLPEELKDVLDPNTRAIMEIEYEHLKNAKGKFGETNNKLELDYPIHYFRLPGGIDLFFKGYQHSSEWQEKHGEYLKRINQYAKIIAIEGFVDVTFGKSLELRWASEEHQYGNYDILMKDAVNSGFNGLFTEVDARDSSKVEMDSTNPDLFIALILPEARIFPQLPNEFFEYYFQYLQKEHPSLAKIIINSESLERILKSQSMTTRGLVELYLNFSRGRDIIYEGKLYSFYPHLTKKGELSFEPTFLELGQTFFSDALAAIKHLLIAKLMVDGYLEKGPIIDYEGANHLSSKTFFLKYPQYAMEVVLRTINELMAGKVENLPQIYEVFRNPNWEEIIKEIVKLVFKKPEKDASKPVEIGPNQRRILNYPVDFLKIYDLDPKKIMPNDKEIKRLIEKLKKSL
jgi:hypothetical protein